MLGCAPRGTWAAERALLGVTATRIVDAVDAVVCGLRPLQELVSLKALRKCDAAAARVRDAFSFRHALLPSEHFAREKADERLESVDAAREEEPKLVGNGARRRTALG